VRFFAWLLSKACIQSRSALLYKHILTIEEAVCPVCGDAEETANHLILGCVLARGFSQALGLCFPKGAEVKQFYSYPIPRTIPVE
jgi:hypothetical protein